MNRMFILLFIIMSLNLNVYKLFKKTAVILIITLETNSKNMGKKSKQNLSEDALKAKQERMYLARKVKRAQTAEKPNIKQQILLNKLKEQSSESHSKNLNEEREVQKSPAQLNQEKSEEIYDKSIDRQVAQVEINQDMHDETYNSIQQSNKALTNQSSQHLQQAKQVICHQDSLVLFFKDFITDSNLSSRMQKEYVNLVTIGLNSLDSEAIKRVRNVFTDEQVAVVYKQYIQDRPLILPPVLKYFSAKERLWLCLAFTDSKDNAQDCQYLLAREIFILVSQVDRFDEGLALSQSQINFLSRTISYALEEVKQISQALIQLCIAADLIPELILVFQSKDSFTDLKDETKFWNYGPGKFPRDGTNRALYRMFFVILGTYSYLTHQTLRSIIENKFTYRITIIELLNQCFPSHQERLVHLLENHIEPDESVKQSFKQMTKCLQFNPKMLEFCKDCDDKKKLTAQNMVVLLEFLKTQSPESINMTMKSTYWEAYSSIKRQRSARCKFDINSAGVIAYVEGLKVRYPGVFQNYQHLEQASKCLETTNDLYQHSVFQTAVACFMIQPGNSAIKSRAGTGKTNMIFITCRYLLERNIQFAIVVANDYLYQQMHNDVNIFFPDSDIEVVTIDSVDGNFAKGKVLILDEADAMIDDHKVIVDADMKHINEIGGVVGLAQADRIVLLSATFEAHHKLFMRQVLQIPSDRVYEFQNVAQIAQNSDQNDLSGKKLAFTSLTQFIELNGLCVERTASKKPIICFIEEHDAKFEVFLAKIAKKVGASFFTIKTIEQAKQYREALKDSSLGIIMLDTKFARGFDLKMAVDGYALVVANGTYLNSTQISQMFGRANRSQGNAEGELVIVDKNCIDPHQAWQIIKAREKAEPTHGYMNLALLTTCKFEIRGQNFQLIYNAFKDSMWQRTQQEFTKSNEKLVRLLKFPVIPILETNRAVERKSSDQQS